MTPPLWAKIISTPINVQLFGQNKTWAGLILGIVAGGYLTMAAVNLAAMMQENYLVMLWGWDADIRRWHIFSLAVGALLGDLAKSWLKRRRGLPAGTSWLGFDQFDAVVGAFICCWLVDLTICGGAWFASTLIPGRWLAVIAWLPVYYLVHRFISKHGHANGLKSSPH